MVRPQQDMSDSIDSASVILVCVTDLYIDKVAGKGNAETGNF